MLCSGLAESLNASLTIRDIPPRVFKAMLIYLYTDQLQPSKPQDVIGLLIAANQFGLESLAALCEGYLQHAMQVEDAPALYHYANELHLPTLKHRLLTGMLCCKRLHREIAILQQMAYRNLKLCCCECTQGLTFGHV